jgi:hypothetical protein
MNSKEIRYLFVIAIHVFLGIIIYAFPLFAKVFGVLIFPISFFYIYTTKNRNSEILYVCAYLVGSEVLFRMTGGFIFNEIGKYLVIVTMIIGIYYSGFSKSPYLFWCFLLLLVPGIIYATMTLSLEANIRKDISFNISGPLCLGISAMYCYGRRITQTQMDAILLCILCPIISIITYMFLYTPSIKEVVTGTSSNFATSGGFGPNQVSTIVGLGVFIVFSRILLKSKSKLFLIVNFLIFLILTFRGIVTFSRGGMFTAFFMIVSLFYIIYKVVNNRAKMKIYIVLGITVIALTMVWLYSSNQTSGLIEKRYTNRDATGRQKEDKLGGREEIASYEMDMFLQNPIIGVGVGKAREVKKEFIGQDVASHNEITRMLGEHGIFGIFGLLILIFTPLVLYVNNKQHIYLLPFYIFWLLTINHAAMRLAAPAFIYALSLLHIYNPDQSKIDVEDVKQ